MELNWVSWWGEALIQAEIRLPAIAQVLAGCMTWAFALGGWWYASHSTGLGSAQFCPAELAGSGAWRVGLLSGTDARGLARMGSGYCCWKQGA